MPAGDLSGVMDLYGKAVPEDFFQTLENDLGLPARQRIFSLPLVAWLMISQHLDPKATLSTAVQQGVQQRPQMLLSAHKRIREGTVSCHTGAYCGPASGGLGSEGRHQSGGVLGGFCRHSGGPGGAVAVATQSGWGGGARLVAAVGVGSAGMLAAQCL